MARWHETLDEAARESLFGIMRSMDLDSLKDEKRYRELSPRFGEIAVGARHFDPWIRFYAAQEFLAALRTGSSVAEARDITRREARLAIKSHNANTPNDIHWQRAPCHADTCIDWLVEQVQRALNDGSVVA